ncbi:putative ribonuclease H protein [Vitis vinifera]|uniref:Putative ribonuclease H protein n=1 Tax=Vitis vinifera TaxID=29760 RepID=A0A438IJK4_VITVI|nr:putative ribonuclease H protein [Vitis vinifera]
MYRGEGPMLRWLQRKEQGMAQGCQLENGQERWFVKAKERYVTGVSSVVSRKSSFTVRGEVFALRRWSPEENSVLSHILQQWGRVTEVQELLESRRWRWIYTVAVTVTGEDDGEDDGGDYIKSESSRSKDEMRSAGGCVLKKPQMVEGLRAIDRTSDCQRWMPRHRLHFSSSDSKSAKGRKEREVGPAHKGSSNGGPFVSSSSKLQGPGLSAKNRASEGLPQASSKTKGSPVSVRRRARSGPPRFDEASSSPKRSFEGGDSLVTNRGKSHSRKSDLSTAASERDFPLSGAFESILIPETSVSLGHPFCVHSSSSYPLESSHAFQRDLFLSLLWVSDNHRGGASCSKGVVVPLETSNQKSKDRPFLREIPSNLEVRGDSVEALFPVQEPSTLPLEGFQIEGLTPRKMVKVQSVLESLRLELSGIMGKVWWERTGILSLRTRFIPEERRKRVLELEERISLGSRKKRRTVRRFLSTQNPDVVMLQETKREIWDRRLVSSIWKGKSLAWVALPACGASGGIVILWIQVFLAKLSVWPNKAVWREDFWLELQDLHGLTFPRWCVGGDFNVIRRISEKMGDSRLTVNMRRFDEFIRESGLLDPLLGMRLLHGQTCKSILFARGRIDRIEQEGNLNLELVSERILRRKELEDLLLKEEVQWRQKSRVKWIKEGDCNSKFFHRVATGRRSRKYIKSLISERGETLNNIEVISEEIVNFFGNLYSKPEGDSWKIEGIDWALFLKRVQFGWIGRFRRGGRLRKVLHETIFGSQGAFVEGRQILDAVLIANEVVDEKRRSCASKEGFSQKWRAWMRGCLSSSSFAILVNGNAKGWVKASRGLRQGDPLSPFLFTLVADVLSRLMIRAEEAGITEGFLVGRDRTRVSLLQFADDTIFFSKASLDLLQNLKIILLVFGQVSGLKINLEKSTISGINTRQEMLSSLALVLECRVSEWPLSYLGLPLGGNPKTIGFWDPVVERISRRLDGWKKAYLSLGGRITLIQSCLSHIPSYFLSLFKIPVSIASKIEKMQRDFLWSGAGEGKRDHLIRWEVVSRPREMGGLGFGKTSMRNSALLGKWLWRFPRERSGLWHKVIASIYGTHPNGWDANMVVRWSHRCPWKAIAQVFQKFSPFVRLVVGNGERIRFGKIFGGETKLCVLNLLNSTELVL